MGKFAKIIELENETEQVLATIDWCDVDENFKMNIRTEVDGMTMKLGLGYDEEQDALDALEKFNEKHAQAIRNDMFNMINE